jgi:hypothetical protein
MKAGRVMPGEVYPRTLAELTREPKPFLRKVYMDPVSHGDWELIKAPTGGIMGGGEVKARASRLGSMISLSSCVILKDDPHILIGFFSSRIRRSEAVLSLQVSHRPPSLPSRRRRANDGAGAARQD